MKAEAIAVGSRLIDQEAGLDRQFAARSVTPATLAAATSAIGQSQAELRATHLRYHLLTIDALTPEQMRRYAELRGYSEPAKRHSTPASAPPLTVLSVAGVARFGPAPRGLRRELAADEKIAGAITRRPRTPKVR